VVVVVVVVVVVNNLLHSSNIMVDYHSRLEGCNASDHSVLKMQYIPPNCC
jgi:hypothetical protein